MEQKEKLQMVLPEGEKAAVHQDLLPQKRKKKIKPLLDTWELLTEPN